MTSRKASCGAASLTALRGPAQLPHEAGENCSEPDAQLRCRRRGCVVLGKFRLQAARERVGHLSRDVFYDFAAPDARHCSLQPQVCEDGHPRATAALLETRFDICGGRSTSLLLPS